MTTERVEALVAEAAERAVLATLRSASATHAEAGAAAREAVEEAFDHFRWDPDAMALPMTRAEARARSRRE